MPSQSAMFPSAGAGDDAFSLSTAALLVPPGSAIQLVELSPANPFRPVDWRWRLALFLCEVRRRVDQRWVDDWVQRASQFIQELQGCRNSDDRQRLARRLPAMDQAVQLYATSASLRRSEIEGRILAGESFEQIAQKCHSSPESIEAYHELFFHVGHRLHAEGYILHMAIGPKVHAGLSEDDAEIMLKRFGYSYGSAGVESILRYLKNPPPLQPCLDGLNLAALLELRLMLQIKALLLTLRAPTDGSTVKTPLPHATECDEPVAAAGVISDLVSRLTAPIITEAGRRPPIERDQPTVTSPTLAVLAASVLPATVSEAAASEGEAVVTLSDLLLFVRQRQDPNASPLALCG